MQDANLFISCVSAEFGRYREPLRDALTRPNVHVKIQEDFVHFGDDTLFMLDKYIVACDAVAHFIGATAGWKPPRAAVERLLARNPALKGQLATLGLAREDLDDLTATQWEAWLAIAAERPLVLLAPAASALGAVEEASQTRHRARLEALARHPVKFDDANHLVSRVQGSVILDVLVAAGHAVTPRKPNNLPYASLGSLFKGRDAFLDRLHAELHKTGRGAVAGKAVHGLGGVGKTRLAIEYAHRFAGEYSALLFVGAQTPERLDSNLAGLASAAVLDLPEQEAREDAVKIPAALGWLCRHPTWLLIFDNIDDETACDAVARYLPKLEGGHVLVTGRLSDYPPEFSTFDLGVLDPAPARDFLLQRTQARREKAADDDAKAAELARELGGLALGLEQAGAYIAKHRIGFARYLQLWREKRETVLGWFDPRQMSYAHDVGLAATWATSVARLDAPSRRLLDRLAFFAPEPIPNFLLDVKADGDDLDAREALPGLFAYSLASSAEYDDGKVKHAGFAVHRLVQDYARRAMDEGRRGEALREALAWVDAGFQGDPADVRTWPRLDPLAPHALALALAQAGDEAGGPQPTADLFNGLGLLNYAKLRYSDAEFVMRRALAISEANLSASDPKIAICLNDLAELLRITNRTDEAEPLIRRALKIDEARYGLDHPTVAIRLTVLALLLRDTNRAAEAEPIFRRALTIFEASYGPDHPNVAISLNNLAALLYATNRAVEAELPFRRALEIDEASYGPDHPNVAIRLNNLAELLCVTNRAAEAEPLFRRALKIDEASYGPDDPNVARDLNNLASLLRDTVRATEAEPLFRRALRIDEASNGPHHPNVAIRLNNLASLLRSTNRAAEAEPLYRRALAIFEASYGPNHPHTHIVRKNLDSLE